MGSGRSGSAVGRLMSKLGGDFGTNCSAEELWLRPADGPVDRPGRKATADAKVTIEVGSRWGNTVGYAEGGANSRVSTIRPRWGGWRITALSPWASSMRSLGRCWRGSSRGLRYLAGPEPDASRAGSRAARRRLEAASSRT